MYYDRSGQPVSDPLEWGRQMTADRRVAIDQVVCGGELIRVSTVFLGIDHSWGGGPPLIFETMCFGGPQQVDGWQLRYSTEEQARAGHRKVVDALRAAELNWFMQH